MESSNSASSCAVPIGKLRVPTLKATVTPRVAANHRNAIIDPIPAKTFMLDNLTQRLTGLVKSLRGQARFTEDNIAESLREVRMVLLEAGRRFAGIKISWLPSGASARHRCSAKPHARSGVCRHCPQELVKLMGGSREHCPHLERLPLNQPPPARRCLDGWFTGAGKTDECGQARKTL